MTKKKQVVKSMFEETMKETDSWRALFCNKCNEYLNKEIEEIKAASEIGLIAYLKRFNKFKKEFIKHICSDCKRKIIERYKHEN